MNAVNEGLAAYERDSATVLALFTHRARTHTAGTASQATTLPRFRTRQVLAGLYAVGELERNDRGVYRRAVTAAPPRPQRVRKRTAKRKRPAKGPRNAKANAVRRRMHAKAEAQRRAAVLSALAGGRSVALGAIQALLGVKEACARRIIRELARADLVVMEPIHRPERGRPRKNWVLKEFAPAQWPARVRKRAQRPLGRHGQIREAMLAILADRAQHCSADFEHLFGEGRQGQLRAADWLRTLYRRGLLTREYAPPQDHKRGAPRMLYRLAEGMAC